MTTVYLSHPIDRSNPSDLSRMDIGYITSMLLDCKINAYDPARAFEVSSDYTVADPTIQTVNDAALEACAGLAAIFRKNERSIGVPIEVERAISLGKPVLIFHDFASAVIAKWATEENVRVVDIRTAHEFDGGVGWLAATLHELAEDTRRHDFGDDGKRKRSRGRGRGKGAQRRIDQPIVFERKVENARLPERAYATDAGFDLFTCQNTVLTPGETTWVPTGVAVDIPDGYWGLVTGRSSTKAKRGLDVTLGVIDEGYSGELLASVYNPHPDPVEIEEGERLVQLVLLPAVGGGDAVWGEIRPKPRGERGFGSSGAAEMHDSPEPEVVKVCCPPNCAGGGVCIDENCTCGGCVAAVS